jgi:hypothetical protein
MLKEANIEGCPLANFPEIAQEEQKAFAVQAHFSTGLAFLVP